MKRFLAVVLLFFSAVCVFAEGNLLFSFAGQSYIQRGVLTFDKREIAITVYVVASADKTKMIVESQAGRLAHIELDLLGNVIVCDGGNDPIVIKKLTDAVTASLGIGANRVAVLSSVSNQ